MMNYKKGKNIEEELNKDDIPIINLPKDFLWMHVKGGTKVFNVLEFAEKAIEGGEQRNVVWSGSGGGVQKTISCAEMLKRKYEFHQVTKLCYTKVDEFWEPQIEGLEQIVATREIPCVHILLSLDEIDPKTPGYQSPNTKTTFWLENAGRKLNSAQGSSKRPNRKDNFKKKRDLQRQNNFI